MTEHNQRHQLAGISQQRLMELQDEIARLKAELELETDQADRWSRQATALQAVADAARHYEMFRTPQMFLELQRTLNQLELDTETAP